MHPPVPDTTPRRPRRLLGADTPALTGLAMALGWLFGLGLVICTPVIWRNQDFLFTVGRAYYLSWHSASLADGLYPLGYPVLLRLLSAALGGDYLLAGKAINLVAWAGLLVGVALLCRRMGLTHLGSAVAVVALAAAPAMMIVIVQPRTDLPATALVVLCIAVLFAGRPRSSLSAGGLAGLAYEFRYNTLLLTAICLIYLLSARRWRPAGWFALGFLIFAGPQVALSWHFRGNPFYSTTFATNVAFGLWGQDNVLRNLPRLMDTPTVVILHAWPLLAEHWAVTFARAFGMLGGGALWAIAAIAGMLLARKQASAKVALAVGLLWMAATAFAHLQARYLVPPAALLAPGIGALVERARRRHLALAALCLVALGVTYARAPNDLASYPREAAEIEYVRAMLDRQPGISRETAVCLGRTYYLSPRLPLPLPQLFVELTRQGTFTWADVRRLLERQHAAYLVTHADDVRAFVPVSMARHMLGSRPIPLDGVSLVRIGHHGKVTIWRVEEHGR